MKVITIKLELVPVERSEKGRIVPIKVYLLLLIAQQMSFKTQCQDEVRTYSAGTHILKVVKWG